MAFMTFVAANVYKIKKTRKITHEFHFYLNELTGECIFMHNPQRLCALIHRFIHSACSGCFQAAFSVCNFFHFI